MFLLTGEFVPPFDLMDTLMVFVLVVWIDVAPRVARGCDSGVFCDCFADRFLFLCVGFVGFDGEW